MPCHLSAAQQSWAGAGKSSCFPKTSPACPGPAMKVKTKVRPFHTPSLWERCHPAPGELPWTSKTHWAEGMLALSQPLRPHSKSRSHCLQLTEPSHHGEVITHVWMCFTSQALLRKELHFSSLAPPACTGGYFAEGPAGSSPFRSTEL